MRSLHLTVRRTAVLVVVAAMVATACGSSSKKSSTATTASSPTTASSGASGTSATTGSSSGAGNTASAPGVTASTIKIGFITSATGNAASTFATSEIGAKAYFDALNKAGGIDGRQVQLIAEDDTSTPAGNLTATQLLAQKGVFGIIDDTPYAFGGYKVATAAGIPVTGSGFDGPEWGVQPDTNMFSTGGGMDPKHDELASDIPTVPLFKSLGTSSVGGLAYGISPSSTASIVDMKTALGEAGLKMSYENLSVPFGGTDVGQYVLALKSAGSTMVVCSCVQSTVLALVTGLKQAGDKADSLSLSSADSTLFADSSAAASAQGVYYSSETPPLDIGNAAATTFEDNIKAAEPSYVMGTYPTFGIAVAYLSSALMAKGLQVAGQNPTRKSFITNLSQVTDWTADGLLATEANFNHFGTSEKQYCTYYVQAKGNTFVSTNGGKAFCGPVPANL
jgi:branched-chain amino acid transport system substrate-binding protein